MISTDVIAAAAAAQLLGDQLASKMKPVRFILPGDNWSGNIIGLQDLKSFAYNRVAVTMAGFEHNDNDAAVGLTLGRLARIPVQRNCGRVKDGPIIATDAYLTSGNSVDYHENQIESIHDLGYLILRQHVNKGGYYFADDPTATSDTDDFKTMSNGRVIDKAYILTYNTYVEDLNDEVIINADGTLDASYVKDMQAKIERAINQNMTAAKEISGVDCFIDHTQNIISTEELGIILDITPVGYSKKLRIKLSLKNPNIQ